MKGNLKKKILCSTLIAAIIVSSLSLNVFAGVGDADRAARAQLFLNAMRHCISVQSQHYGDSDNDGKYHTKYDSGELQSGSGIFTSYGSAYYVGQNYEEQYGTAFFGSSDGKINCDENVAQAFADSIGVSITDIVCNKFTGGSKGGLFVRATTDSYGAATINDVACNEFGTDDYVWNPDAMEYLQELYNDFVDNLDTSAAVRWDDINDVSKIENFGSVTGYSLYKQLFDKYCNGGEIATDATYNVGAHWPTAMKVIDESTGTTREVYIANNSGIPNKYVTTFTGKSITCDELIQKLNDFTDDYLAVIKDDLNREKGQNCAQIWEDPSLGDKRYSEVKKSVEYARSEGIRPPESYQRIYDSYAAAAAQHWVDSNGQCLTINLEDEDLDEVVEELVEKTDLQNRELVIGTLPGQGTADNEVVPLDDCFNAADAMGWWACPFTFALGNALSEIYDGFIVPALTVDPELLNTENGAYIAWGYFRDFANLLFVILLLIVILSQVTGFGIDNYGIKKLLPKMIIAAILVNLSYIICQLAVDISNIIGTSMYGLFAETMAEGIHVSTGEMNDWLHDLVWALLGAMGGAAIWGMVSLSSGWAVLLPLILSFISAVISVIFMFVLLAARQAGVLILVVISPLALVLYALPNTNSLAKKWFDTFKALLMVFPICGAVVGGGFLASKIIFSTNSGNFLTQLISMLVMIVPYFFIPSLIKSSIAQVNGIGAKLSGLGSKISGSATGLAGRAIRSSTAYQQSEERGAMRKAQRAANSANRTISRMRKRYGDSSGNIDTNKLSRRQRQMLGQAYAKSTYDESAYLAGATAAAEETDIKNAMAMYTAGGVESGGATVNPDSVESLQAAMENEGAAGNVTNMMALKRMLESKGKAGYNAVGRAFDSEKLRGNATSMNRLASSIAGDANYKNQSRSVHTAANSYVSGNSGVTAQSIRSSGGAIGSMKSSEISQMTDDEFQSFIAQGQSGNADAVRMANEALADDTIRAQLNSREIESLQRMAGRGGEPVGPSGYTTSEQQEMFRQRSEQANEQYQRSQAQEGQDFKIDR